MRPPILMLISALVVLGHWLLLAPGVATLARLAKPETMSTARPEPSPLRAMQTRRIVSAPLTGALASPNATSRTSLAQVATERNDASTAQETASPANLTLEASTPPELTNTNTNTSLASVAPPEPEPTAAADALASWRLPQSVRLNYDIQGQSRGLNYKASGVLDWEQDGSRYNARLVASVFFLGNRTLSSQGEITAEGLAPTRFADRARSEQAAHFQADKGKITFSGNTPDAPWQPGAQDRLSVFFQLAGMLSGQPERFVTGTRVPVYTASARAADTWAFQVDGTETLNLPAGETPAIKLTRQSRLEHDQLIEVWFAPSLSYWPVRIRLTQRNGDFVDQQLASVAKP